MNCGTSRPAIIIVNTFDANLNELLLVFITIYVT